MHISHCHLIFTSEKLAIRSVRYTYIIYCSYLTIFICITPFWNRYLCHHYYHHDQPCDLTCVWAPPHPPDQPPCGPWTLRSVAWTWPGLAAASDLSSLAPPHCARACSCKILRSYWPQWAAAESGERRRPGHTVRQTACRVWSEVKLGLSSSQIISCFLPLGYSPAPLWWWSSGTRGSCPGRSRSCSVPRVGYDLPAPPRTCRQCWQNTTPRPLKHFQTDLQKFRRFCFYLHSPTMWNKSPSSL